MTTKSKASVSFEAPPDTLCNVYTYAVRVDGAIVGYAHKTAAGRWRAYNLSHTRLAEFGTRAALGANFRLRARSASSALASLRVTMVSR